MDKMEKRKTPVLSSASIRSWVAGVLDAGLRVVMSRTYHPRAAQLQVYLRADDPLLTEVHDALGGMGGFRRQGASNVLAFTIEDTYFLWQEVAPLMRGYARDMLRIAAAWGALSPGRGRGAQLTEEMIDQRCKLLAELKSLKAQMAEETIAEEESEEQEG